MSKVNIELDLSIVQQIIHAKVEPAVAKILDGIDLPDLIEKSLLKVPDKRERYLSPLMYMTGGYSDQRPVDDLLNAAIHEAAMAYVKKAVDREREKIEAAFEATLRKSASTLANTMFNSLNSALENDWSFQIETRMKVK